VILFNPRVPLAIFSLFLICSGVYAQREATHWVFGGKAGLDFSCYPPRLEVSSFDGLEGAASISDANGNLLFYTTGDVVWNHEHHIMPNGRGIGGLCTLFASYSSSSQSALIIPHPGNSNLYFIFTTDCAEDNFVDGIRYSIVDMSMQGGLGDVIQKNTLLLAPTAEKLAAVFHANGSDVWLMTHGVGSNSFYAFRISASGINTTPVISSTGQFHRGGRGYLKFSPDGKRIAVGSFQGAGEDGEDLEIFSFDDNNGNVTSEFVLPEFQRAHMHFPFLPMARCCTQAARGHAGERCSNLT
jgi:hypothetical protein